MALRFRWIVPRVLAGMERPGSYHPLAEDIALMKRELVGVVLSLTEQPLDETQFRAAGIDLLHVPVPDFDAPRPEQIERIVTLVDRTSVDGKATLVHCLAGLGRTGTIAACYIAHRDRVDGITAIRAARAVEPGYIQSPRQEDFVIAFAASRVGGATS